MHLVSVTMGAPKSGLEMKHGKELRFPQDREDCMWSLGRVGKEESWCSSFKSVPMSGSEKAGLSREIAETRHPVILPARSGSP